ncbi:NAD(P)/FAD-dependent oxidoreductase [Pararhizobium mangrovi]|uniref:FAD-dependent oxidoreductase n=1 Tax=Pararhizobium mangrovi TaxID=2590452 RepID=A0A506U5L5_9HYPH|nr:FAD-dependent oxidoreductase [Pararhizobium mangrovi]TPW28666.1 FAD-dependent oxidoreductase [Pararhizobium mangrovi]
MAERSEDVVVVGAGIVGLAAAHKLQRAGRSVTLVDPSGIARRTSTGNAAALAFSDIVPMATRGMILKAPKWLMDPLGPLSIPPAYLPRILPWLVRFWRAGWPDRVERAIAAQAAMMRLARSEMGELVEACDLSSMIRRDGSLELYESEAELRASEADWRRREAESIAFEHVRGSRLAELQPGLSPRIAAGTFVPDWETVSEPYEFASAIGRHVLEHGATLREEPVKALEPTDDGVRVILAGGTTLSARGAVLAAGAWSRPLAATLGDRIPLETERGYNTTLPSTAFDLRRQLIFSAQGFVITPLSNGLRVGGAVELGGLDRPPNYDRAKAMMRVAQGLLPGLDDAEGREWMGHRPSLPDSLPAIGPSRTSPNVVYAFGHGHLGLTQSAAAGRLVADCLCARKPAIDLEPFSPQRF